MSGTDDATTQQQLVVEEHDEDEHVEEEHEDEALQQIYDDLEAVKSEVAAQGLKMTEMMQEQMAQMSRMMEEQQRNLLAVFKEQMATVVKKQTGEADKKEQARAANEAARKVMSRLTSTPSRPQVSSPIPSSNSNTPFNPQAGSPAQLNDSSASSVTGKKDWVKFGLRFSARQDEDIEAFLTQFETCCILNDVPESQYVMLLGLYVKDLASTYLREVQKQNPDSEYKTVRKLFSQKVKAGKSAEQTAMELSNIKQGGSESVKDYFNRFRKTVAQSDLEETSPFILLYFRVGLKAGIKEAVLPLTNKTLTELYQAAVGAETGLRSNEATTPMAVNAFTGQSGQPKGKFGSSSHSQRACYTCGDFTHYARECPKGYKGQGGYTPRGRGTRKFPWTW